MAERAMVAPPLPPPYLIPHPSLPLVPVTAPDPHDRTPMVDALRAYQKLGTAAFSTPGHKGGQGVDPDLRVLLGEQAFAADVWLNTADHDRALRAAETLGADAWGADRAFFLVNGSSSGNHAFLMAALAPGDEVIIGRDVHCSMMTALIQSGARTIWVTPRLHPTLDMGLGLHPDDVAEALRAHPNAKLVVLVSPTYWGVTSNLSAIVTVSHDYGVPVYVDQAWGPHLPFHPRLPIDGMTAGADGATTSPHKLLGGLSQAALLLAQGERIDTDRLSVTVRMSQSTSPLLPILASLDACRRQMVRLGHDLMDRTLALADEARARLGAMPGLRVIGSSELGLPPSRVDATRLVIDVRGLGLTGFAVERELRERFGVAPEMSDLVGVVCLVSIGDTSASIERLVSAFATLAREHAGARPRSDAPRSAGFIAAPSDQILTPRDAFFSPTRMTPLMRAVGEIAAELIVPYPPGIPVLAPGERISADKAEYLRAVAASGAAIRGASDPSMTSIRIVSLTA